MVNILTGDCIDVMREMEAGSVNCCVTSPPYWGLRDYGVDGQLGLETTPEEYVLKMVDVCREVERVLRDDGTLWLNIGDSYAMNGLPGGNPSRHGGELQSQAKTRTVPSGLKPKDLVGVPWRVAFALQADGWYLRQDIIWHKPNPMPESMQDRCTKAHEYIFLLSKNPKYYYDHEAIKEPVAESQQGRVRNDKVGGSSHKERGQYSEGGSYTTGKNSKLPKQASGNRMVESVAKAKLAGGSHDQPFGTHRNKRSVWTVTTKSFKEAHFATFPPALIRPCILAGCPMGGTVLDPFGGSGTTGMVAEEEGRNSILIELNPKYAEMAKRRTAQGGLFCANSQHTTPPTEGE